MALPRVRRVSYPAGATEPTSATSFEADGKSKTFKGDSQKMVTGSLVFRCSSTSL